MRWLQDHAVPVGAALAANTGAAGAMHRVACFAGLPAPTGTAQASGSRCTCGSGRGREHRRSRCHTPRRLLRGLARSHRYCAGFGITLYLWERPWPRTPAQPVPSTASPASRACPLPQVLRWLRVNAVPVGAAVAANTGAAGAMHRVACFAGLPAPTGTALASGSRCTCGSGFSREHRRSRCHPPRRASRACPLPQMPVTSTASSFACLQHHCPATSPPQPAPPAAPRSAYGSPCRSVSPPLPCTPG